MRFGTRLAPWLTGLLAGVAWAADPPTPTVFEKPVRLKAADGVIDSGPSWGHSGRACMTWMATACATCSSVISVGSSACTATSAPTRSHAMLPG